jgi:guanine deaminase
MIKIAVFKGRVVTTPAFGELAITENCYVGVNGSGVIEFVDDDFDRVSRQYPEYFQSQAVLVDLGEKFMVAGFVDCHCHGAQYGNAGTGTDLPLLQWLETYTFPTEQRFASLDVAREVYTKCARSTLRNGTTTCSYFATIHADATMLFADILATVGQRAFVGKVCMDRNSPSTYVETCEQSLLDTKRVVEHVNALADRRVYPVVTPRFVPSCSSTLMRGLGAIAREHCTLIQSHVSENRSEVEWVAALHKDADSYVQCYDAHDLLTSSKIAFGFPP